MSKDLDNILVVNEFGLQIDAIYMVFYEVYEPSKT